MKWLCILFFLFFSSIFFPPEQDTIYYISLNYAVHKGFYYPTSNVETLLAHGDFGIGSESELKSEVVLLEGRPYAFSSDGKARELDKKDELTFGVSKFFKAEKEIIINRRLRYKQFIKLMDSVMVYNGFSAIRVDASFEYVKYHCYTKQEWPYKPTKLATYVQFEQKNVEGTLVGFHTPHAAAAINSPDYHFHFINSGRTHGGHLDKCIVKNIRIQLDYANKLEVQLPDLRRVNIDKVRPK